MFSKTTTRTTIRLKALTTQCMLSPLKPKIATVANVVPADSKHFMESSSADANSVDTESDTLSPKRSNSSNRAHSASSSNSRRSPKDSSAWSLRAHSPAVSSMYGELFCSGRCEMGRKYGKLRKKHQVNCQAVDEEYRNLSEETRIAHESRLKELNLLLEEQRKKLAGERKKREEELQKLQAALEAREATIQQLEAEAAPMIEQSISVEILQGKRQQRRSVCSPPLPIRSTLTPLPSRTKAGEEISEKSNPRLNSGSPSKLPTLEPIGGVKSSTSLNLSHINCMSDPFACLESSVVNPNTTKKRNGGKKKNRKKNKSSSAPSPGGTQRESEKPLIFTMAEGVQRTMKSYKDHPLYQSYGTRWNGMRDSDDSFVSPNESARGPYDNHRTPSELSSSH